MRVVKIKELIKTFLKTPIRVISTGWVMTNCPFARYTHVDGDDRKFSFGISVKNGYHCFTCGKKGSLFQLPKALARYNRFYDYELEEFISLWADEEEDNISVSQGSVVLDPTYYTFKALPHPRGHKHLDYELSQRWDIRIDEDRGLLFFPYYDVEKRLVNVKVRSLHEKKFYYLIPGVRIWYGEWLLSKDKYVVLVEGERDAVLVSKITKMDVLATAGMPTIDMFRKLKIFGKEVFLLWFDNDDVGRRLTNIAMNELDYGHVFIFDYDGLGIKDPAELVERGIYRQCNWFERFIKL